MLLDDIGGRLSIGFPEPLNIRPEIRNNKSRYGFIMINIDRNKTMI